MINSYFIHFVAHCLRMVMYLRNLGENYHRLLLCSYSQTRTIRFFVLFLFLIRVVVSLFYIVGENQNRQPYLLNPPNILFYLLLSLLLVIAIGNPAIDAYLDNHSAAFFQSLIEEKNSDMLLSNPVSFIQFLAAYLNISSVIG